MRDALCEMMWSRASTRSADLLRSSEDPAGEGDASARELAHYRDLMVLKRWSVRRNWASCHFRGAGEVAGIGVRSYRVNRDRIAGAFIRVVWRPIKPDYLTDRLGANLDGMLADTRVERGSSRAYASHLPLRRLHPACAQ